MATIEEAARTLAASQTAVLYLDTCDFLDVVRGIAEGNLFNAKSFNVIRESLAGDHGKFQVLITYLVRHEWEQNKPRDKTRGSVKLFLEEAANSMKRIVEAREVCKLPPLSVDDGLFDPLLASNLFELAEDVMDRAMVLEKDDACVNLALARVMSQDRPSHNNQIKDSIHWEHYLELSRRLAAAGHSASRIFVSANKADFWADRSTPMIHPVLKKEADAAGLQFFGKLDDALRALGVP